MRYISNNIINISYSVTFLSKKEPKTLTGRTRFYVVNQVPAFFFDDKS